MPLFATERELSEAQNRLRRFFGNDFAFDTFPLTEPVGWVPKVEIVETENELVLTAELPGMVKENIDISFEDELLTIQGETKAEKEEKSEEKVKNGTAATMCGSVYGPSAVLYAAEGHRPAKITAR
jgi:HSP20 family protein